MPIFIFLRIEFSDYQWITEILGIKLYFLNRKGISFVSEILASKFEITNQNAEQGIKNEEINVNRHISSFSISCGNLYYSAF